jgi:hypothetical protein
MTDDPQPDRRPALRASDADRERVVEILRHAAGEGRLDVEELDERVTAAYSVRTLTDLETLTHDLVPGSQTPPHPAGTGQVAVRPGASGTSRIISIMSGHERRGRWRVATRCLVLSLMGGADLDLNEAELCGQVTTMRVITIMGGAEIRLPRGVDVQVSKFALMGGHDVELSPETPTPGAPTIELKLLSIMGGVQVRQGPRPPRTGVGDSVREALGARREALESRYDAREGRNEEQ